MKTIAKKAAALLLCLALACTALTACAGSAAGDSLPQEPVSSTADTAGESAGSDGQDAPAPGEEDPAQGLTIRLGGLKGPTSMGMVKLLSDAENGNTANAYEFTLAAAADELTPLLVQGQMDILAVPANLASVLYNKTEGGVQLLAINTLGVLYVVEKGGETVNSLADLKGKTVYATGKGNTPEYCLNYLLAQNGLTLGEDVQVEWKSEATEVVSQMATEESAVALLPQPFVTVAQTQLEGLRVALDLTAEWNALENGSTLVTGVLVVRRAFAQEHPAELQAFLQEYAASTQFANDQPAEAAQLIEQYGIVKAAVAEKALPYCNIVCLTGEEMQSKASAYLQVLFDQNPASVGGSLPGEDFYWSAD